MTCYSSSINPVPICGGPAILICVQASADAFPQPAWVSAVCTEGEVDSFALFSDAELAVPLAGYTIADRVRCPESLVGATCETAMSTNLCPDTIAAIDEVVDDQTAEINAKTDEQTTDLEDALTAQTATLKAAIDDTHINYSYSAFVYNGDGNLTSYTRTRTGYPAQTRTFTYTAGELTAVSAWA